MPYPEHTSGLSALCFLCVSASTVALFYKGTPQRIIRDLVSSCSSTHSTTSDQPQPASTKGDQPQPPIKRLLDVPDLVENVFLRLDPASRQAFFESHPLVAQAGPVLAHTKLRIELLPTSLEDQWQRVQHLTSSQPVRCLVISGPNKEQLRDFLRWVPEGKRVRKHRVLQGTEVQLEVHIKLEAGGIPHLQDLMRRWRNDQQLGAEDTRGQLVLDLCGRELIVAVRVASERVRFEGITVKGSGTPRVVVDVVSGGRLEMEGCHVEVATRPMGADVAVRVGGAGAGLCSQGCSMQSILGIGLLVCGGARAHHGQQLWVAWGIGRWQRQPTQRCPLLHGWEWREWCGRAEWCARLLAPLQQQWQRGGEGCGWYIAGQASILEAFDSSASGNKLCGAVVAAGGKANLSRVTARRNGVHGFTAIGLDSRLEASDSSTSNKIGWCAVGPGSTLVAKACKAFNNNNDNTNTNTNTNTNANTNTNTNINDRGGDIGEASGGCIIILDG